MLKTPVIAALLAALAPAAPAGAATFLFIRHAESTTNAGTATTPAELIDPPLTALGQQQALDLVDALAGYDITTIYTSAYQRTQLTIAPTAAALGLTPIADARTNEWYFGDVTNVADFGNANLGGVIGAWASGDTGAKADLPNSESLDDMAARVLPAWEEIVAAHKDEEGTVLLIGHGAETGYVLPYFAQNVSLGFAFANGLRNTGIVQLEVIGDKPYVTNWQGTALAVPAAVPEPAGWLMLLTGFGAIGVALRRSRSLVPRPAVA